MHSERCPVCGGTGKIPNPNPTAPVEVVCHGCGGCGWVAVKD